MKTNLDFRRMMELNRCPYFSELSLWSSDWERGADDAIENKLGLSPYDGIE